MSIPTEARPARKNINNANITSDYVMLAIAIIVGLVGVFLRFAQDSFTLSMISNVLLLAGWVIAIRVVFKILK